MAVPPDFVRLEPDLTDGEYETCAARLRREMPSVRFHGERLTSSPVDPSEPAYSLWVHRDDLGDSSFGAVHALVFETRMR